MNTEEFGRLGTREEHLTYALILEQRKTNELLQTLVDQNKQPEPVVEEKPTKKRAPKLQKEGVEDGEE